MPSIPRQHENLVDALGRYRLLKPTLVVFDLLVFLLAFIFSYLLRFDFQIPSNHSHNLIVQAPFIVLLQFVALTLTGGRDFIWRYTGLAHVKAFIYAALSSMALVASMRLLLVGSHQVWRVPLSINLFDGILAFGGAFALRVLRRTAYEHYKRRAQVKMQGPVAVARRPVLLIGAGQAGVLAANEIAGRGDLNLEIKGFVDD
ncbi:MAG TPA: hypothetical protein VE863_19450, partial [Pyrinomonadaceae bacterium]|nr:hypothetical protein [Pyrinomonadaceae bacterium]